MAFWDKLRRKKNGGGEPETSDRKPVWVAASSNRFGVPVLDLTPAIGGLTSFTKDPESARRAVSWGAGIGDELFGESDFAETIECELSYPADSPLPDGLLFCPSAMEDKWVFALRGDSIRVGRSWTGKVGIEARVHRGAGQITIRRLRSTSDAPLRMLGDYVETFDWMFRTHVLGQVLPLPVNDDGAVLLEDTPLIAFSAFGSKAICAAKSWSPPSPERGLRSDGAMLVATRAADLEQLRQLVAIGEPIDAPSTFEGYTPLHVAAVKSELALVEELLKLGADPEKRADGGAIPLILALVHGADLSVFELLVDHGADPKAANDDGFGALHAIAELDNPETLPWFLELGLDLERRTNRGHTPLQIASALGHLVALQALASAGADIDAPSPNGTPRDIALAQNKPEAVALLEKLSH